MSAVCVADEVLPKRQRRRMAKLGHTSQRKRVRTPCAISGRRREQRRDVLLLLYGAPYCADKHSMGHARAKPLRRREARKKKKPPRAMPADKFLRILRRVTPSGSVVQFDVEVDDQKYGATIIGRFVMTNVRRAKNGKLECAHIRDGYPHGTRLPSSAPRHVVRAIRKVLG